MEFNDRRKVMKSAIDRISDPSSVGDTAYDEWIPELPVTRKVLSDSDIKDSLYRKQNPKPAAKKFVPKRKESGK